MSRLFKRRTAAETIGSGPSVAVKSSPTYELTEVFTPGQPADKAFVRRLQEEQDFADALDERGTQVLVWGESGAGKTSLVLSVLRSRKQAFITTRCTAGTTYPLILASAFERINALVLERATNHDTRTLGVGTEIGGSVSPVTLKTEAEWEKGRSEDFVSLVPAQLTAEALALRMGQKGLVWVIEDFHKVSDETRKELSDAMKVFSDESVEHPRLTLVVLGVSESAGDILTAPANMGGRLADIELASLDDDQLGEILDTGQDLLNVDFADVRELIIRHSVGVASITHALAAECCRAAGVRSTSESRTPITAAALEVAKAAYTRKRSGDMRQKFDTALEVVATRRYHNYAIILKALASLDEGGATHAEILAQIRLDHPNYPPGNLTTYLRKLQADDRSALIRKTSQGRFRYDQPLQHAYAILRFKRVTSSGAAAFWTTNELSVSEGEKDEAARLADEENLTAPDEVE
jgi:hypothetical protein